MKKFTVKVLTTTGMIEIITKAEDKIQAIDKIEARVEKTSDWVMLIGLREWR